MCAWWLCVCEVRLCECCVCELPVCEVCVCVWVSDMLACVMCEMLV